MPAKSRTSTDEEQQASSENSEPKVLATAWPHDEFDPGDGLPVITNAGTEVPADQIDQVQRAADAYNVRLTEKG